jgi:hypothetical protein
VVFKEHHLLAGGFKENHLLTGGSFMVG